MFEKEHVNTSILKKRLEAEWLSCQGSHVRHFYYFWIPLDYLDLKYSKLWSRRSQDDHPRMYLRTEQASTKFNQPGYPPDKLRTT